jgi:small GTP-binding protein
MSYVFKILLCGPAAVGKTSLVDRFISKKFKEEYKLTVGVDCVIKEIDLPSGNKVSLSIWDIAGQQRFEFIRKLYYEGARGILLVFDLTRPETYDEVVNLWLKEARDATKTADLPFVLIGNKLDLVSITGEMIDRGAARAFAEQEGSTYIETSAVDGTMVDEAFLELAQRMVHTGRVKAGLDT